MHSAEACVHKCFYTHRSFEICQVRMLVKQRRTHGWSSYLPGKNTFILKQKSSNLYIIMFEVSENLSEYVFMHTAVACVHKCFTLTGHLKSAKNECLSNSVANTAEAVTCSLHQLNYEKIFLHTLYHEKTRKVSFSHEKATQNFVCTKKQRNVFTCTWPEHSTIVSSWTLKCNASAVVVVAEKMWISQTCCDYLVAAACEDGSAWNERKKLPHFYQLVVTMAWDLWKSYARTFGRLALLRWCNGNRAITRFGAVVTTGKYLS